jgi:hypothetical protein
VRAAKATGGVAVDGCVVAAVVELPGTYDAAVLLDPDRRPAGVEAWHPYHNIVRVSPDGVLRWRAELLPQETTAKCWLGLQVDGSLRATTYSWECELDPESGRIISSEFTK